MEFPLLDEPSVNDIRYSDLSPIMNIVEQYNVVGKGAYSVLIEHPSSTEHLIVFTVDALKKQFLKKIDMVDKISLPESIKAKKKKLKKKGIKIFSVKRGANIDLNPDYIECEDTSREVYEFFRVINSMKLCIHSMKKESFSIDSFKEEFLENIEEDEYGDWTEELLNSSCSSLEAYTSLLSNDDLMQVDLHEEQFIMMDHELICIDPIVLIKK